MELLVSIALDPDTMQALEKSNGTVCLKFVCFYQNSRLLISKANVFKKQTKFKKKKCLKT